MKYADGTTIQLGDLIQIDTNHRGTVVASMDTNQYLPGEEHWAYLGVGIMVDTSFGGLVHYTTETIDHEGELILIARERAGESNS